MCLFLESAKREAKNKGLDPKQVMCMLQGIGGLCDGTNCIGLDVTEPMDPDTLQDMGQANVENFYQKLENRQALVRH